MWFPPGRGRHASFVPNPLRYGRQRAVCNTTHMDSAAIIKRLQRDGWTHRKTKGRHQVFEHPTKPGHVVVTHPRKDLPTGTVRNIYRQAGWDWRER